MSTLCTATPVRAAIRYDEAHEFFATFSFNPPESTTERPALEIAVALDVSGSMQGRKLNQAKASLLKLVEHLTATDKLAVVEFGSQVNPVFALMAMTAENKRKAIQAINNIQSHGCTNLSGGLFKALDFLKDHKAPKGTVRRCMIFTDGRANEGIKDTEKLVPATMEYRSGIAISGFGYGNDHDEDLLQAISQGGNFYYIDEPDKILAAFGAELGGLLTTYGQNVELRLTPSKGVKIVEVLNDLTVTEDGDAVVVACDDLLAGQEGHIVVRLQTEARSKALPRKVSIVKAVAKFYNVVETKPDEVAFKLQVKFVPKSKADTEDNKKVLEEVALQKMVKAQAAAIAHSDRGDFDQARQVLFVAAAFAEDVGTDKAAAYGAMSRGLAAESHTAASYAAGGRKLASSTHGSTRKRQAVLRGTNLGGVDSEALFSSVGTRAVVDNFTAAPPEPDPAQVPAGTVKPEDINSGIWKAAMKGSDEEDDDSKDSGKSYTLSKSRSRSSW